MGKREKLQYEKPQIAVLRIMPEESNSIAAQRNEASSWSGESCYKICWDRNRDSNRAPVGVSTE